jgi:dienelactone hydrolase
MLVIAGCSTISVLGGRSCRADAIANKAGFEKEYIEAGNFTLLTYKKITKPGESVRIYIEGDGNAWETKRRLSDDPTPRQPIALYLASDDPSANIVYIARPGQFSQNDYMACDPAYWSSKRFSPEVIDSFNEVIDKVKTVAGAPSIELVGYSGGGAIAVLAAAKRSDVAALRTVAGNLDHKALCEYHRVSALKGSLNPIDSAAAIKKIPQRHFVGSKDSVVPAPIARSFVDRQGNGKLDRVTVVNGATHSKGWPERWKDLLILLPS